MLCGPRERENCYCQGNNRHDRAVKYELCPYGFVQAVLLFVEDEGRIIECHLLKLEIVFGQEM